MNINYVAVLVAAVAQFIFGAIWYMPLFGKMWGRIHGFDNQSPEVQAQMRKGMAPLLVTQFIFTIVTTVVFAMILSHVTSDWSTYCFALAFWLGFIVPTQVAAVIFGGTNPQWFVQKILIMIGGGLGCMLIIAAVFNFFK